jgi:hypothetical protein
MCRPGAQQGPFMQFAQNYRGQIPMQLYVELSNKFPQGDAETDQAWLRRVKHDPAFAQKMFGTPEFKTELIQAVTRRQMAMAGARRVGADHAGPNLVKVRDSARRTELGLTANTEMAPAYRNEFMTGNSDQYRYAKEAYDQLIGQFDAATPPDGSIFWNGINELSLAKLVDTWNTDLQGEVFGQLEATTAARYVNKQFVWEEGAFKQFFEQASDKLGQVAKGHVTSVVRCGLRFDSIFTTTELPRMFGSMEAELARGKDPAITDMSFVVIQPKTETGMSVKVYVNNEISKVAIVRPKPGMRINGPEFCNVDGYVRIPDGLAAYWARPSKSKVTESKAATRVKSDFDRLIKWP